MSDDKLPGDPQGHLKLLFRLAEIIGDVEQADAPNETIKNLNVAFREFRECNLEDRSTAGANLAAHLDNITQEYPDLIPKIADFQSQVDELQREFVELRDRDRSLDDDFPL